MFLEKVFIFILFLGPLVFFHELGHFLFARLFGVRVEVFSIGFGPKLFKWKKGDTEYAFSLIPLGGYVKMFGDDPLSEIQLSEEEKKVAFTEKSKWAKFWIVFGGPLANFIMAYFLYAFLFMTGEKVPQARFGIVPQDSQYYQIGVRSGDPLVKVNETQIIGFDDLNLIDSEINRITVSRLGKEIELPLKVDFLKFLNDFGSFRSELKIPIVVDKSLQRWAISLVENKVDLEFSLESISEANAEKIYLFPITNKTEVTKLEEYTFDFENKKMLSLNGEIHKLLINEGFYFSDLLVSKVVDKSPAASANIQKNDILIQINDKQLSGFIDLRNTIQKAGANTLKLSIIRNGKAIDLDIVPEKREIENTTIYSIGVWSGAQFIPIKMVDTVPKGFVYSFKNAFGRTINGIVKTFQGYKKLFTNQVPLSNIGGPLAIGKVASDSFNISLSMFFRLMAIISINLGLINLFPIPVLDGGHIVFLILETINRGPLSRKKVMLAQQFGMSLLFLLIFVALFNDLTRLF